jgi:hypothetical protein
MENLWLIVFCMLLGIISKQIKLFPANASQTLNTFVIYFALPATILIQVPKLHLDWALLLPFSVGIVVFGLSIVFFECIGKLFQYDRKTIGCLVLCCGFGNTSFVGFPLIEAWYGKEALSIAILADQSTFLTLSTLGIFTAIRYASLANQKGKISKQIFQFPPFWAFLIALFLLIFRVNIAGTPYILLGRLAQTLTPLALFSVGLQLTFDQEVCKSSALWNGLLYKLTFAPALYWLAFQIDTATRITIIEAAMPPMITSSIIAAQYELHPRLASMLVGIGIPFSLGSVAIWVWVLS